MAKTKSQRSAKDIAHAKAMLREASKRPVEKPITRVPKAAEKRILAAKAQAMPPWLEKMSKKARDAYFKAHPRSKYHPKSGSNYKAKLTDMVEKAKPKAVNDNTSSQLRMLQASLVDRKLAVKRAQAKVASARTDASRAKHTKALEQAKRQLKQTQATHARIKRGG